MALALSVWDRFRRISVELPVRPMIFMVAKIGAYLVVGGGIVFMLNLPRSLVAANPIRGVPIVVPIVIVLMFAGTFVLNRTKFGRYLYAVGGNPEAARRAGINVASHSYLCLHDHLDTCHNGWAECTSAESEPLRQPPERLSFYPLLRRLWSGWRQPLWWQRKTIQCSHWCHRDFDNR